MTDEVEIPPWNRLQRLSEISVLEERGAHATRWASELMSRHGADAMPPYIWTAHRDMIAAVLLSLVDDHPAASDQGDVGSTGWSNGYARQVIDAPRSDSRSSDVAPSVIRAWAQQKGISISDRGRIPMWVIKRYQSEYVAREVEQALARKILAALEQHGELTKSELWDIIGRNHPSSKIENALKFLPNIQVYKGESSGGRPPVIYRLVEEELDETNELSERITDGQFELGNLGDTDDFPSLAVNASDPDTADSKIHDFLQMLRGESRSD